MISHDGYFWGKRKNTVPKKKPRANISGPVIKQNVISCLQIALYFCLLYMSRESENKMPNKCLFKDSSPGLSSI